jgi:repressor LexA
VKGLTDKQTAVLAFIRQRMEAGLPCPSHRDIAEHFGYASSFAAGCHVRALITKRALQAEPGKPRSLHVPQQRERRATMEVPIYGSIPAGLAEDREQESEGCIAVDVEELQLRPTARTFALRVRGDSMIGVGILDGDLVLLENGGDPRPGQIVAALIDGQSTLKTFLLKGRKPFLRAENPKYPDLIPAADLMIQGVFRALIRKAK